MLARRTILIAGISVCVFVLVMWADRVVVHSTLASEADSQAGQGIDVSSTQPKQVQREVSAELEDLFGPSAAEGLGRPRICRKNDGRVHFLSAPRGRGFKVESVPAGGAEQTAKAFLSERRRLFVADSAAVDFATRRVRQVNRQSFVRLEQTYAGLPVYAAEVIVRVDEDGSVGCVVSDIMSDTDALDMGRVSTEPTIDATTAQQIALDFMAGEYGPLRFETTEPELVVFEPTVVGKNGQVIVAWVIEVGCAADKTLRQQLVVDGHRGDIAHRSPLFHNARYTVTDEVPDPDIVWCQGNDYPTEVDCNGDAATEYDLEFDWAYGFVADACEFFEQLGYEYQTEEITVKLHDPPTGWGGGGYIGFANGEVQQDTVAHEFTHIVTGDIVGFNYGAVETGAICESYSDMFGEWVDQSSDYDSNDRLDFADSGCNFSVAAWVKRDANGRHEYILDKRDKVSEYYEHGWGLSITSDNKVKFYVNTPSQYAFVSDATILADGNFHFVCGVLDNDANTITVYVDDESKSGLKYGVEDLAVSSNLFIGRKSFAESGYFDGVIDNVMICESALSPAQVSSLWNGGNGTESPPSSCIAHWKMNDNEDKAMLQDTADPYLSGTYYSGSEYQNTSSCSVAGKVNAAIEFDGNDDYVLVDIDDDSNAMKWIMYEDYYKPDEFWPWRRLDDPPSCTTDPGWYPGGPEGLPQPDWYHRPDHWYYGNSVGYRAHHNLGVGNKLVYLLTDGDTFNGYDITGMGISGAAEVFFQALNYLTPACKYADLGSALPEAARDLVWSESDVAEVIKACAAVEIRDRDAMPPPYYGIGGPPYEYVVITSEALAAEQAGADNDFRDLCDSKWARGISACIVTTEMIYGLYDGIRDGEDIGDDPAKVREFLFDAYTTWGTKYCLLGGAGNSNCGETAIVPIRWLTYFTYGDDINRETASDLYYACLVDADYPGQLSPFDYDGDGFYGESDDGWDGDEVDLDADIYVGRAAVETTDEVANFVKKILIYESCSDSYLAKAAATGEYLGYCHMGGSQEDENNPYDPVYWSKRYGETLLRGSDNVPDNYCDKSYSTLGFDDNALARPLDFNTATTFYDVDDQDYIEDYYEDPEGTSWNVNQYGWSAPHDWLPILNSQDGNITPHIIYSTGHGGNVQGCSDTGYARYAEKMFTYYYSGSGSWEEKTNTELFGCIKDLENMAQTVERPFFVYDDRCNAGDFTQNDCFAEEITAMEDGAFAVIMCSTGAGMEAVPYGRFFFHGLLHEPNAAEPNDQELLDYGPRAGVLLQYARERAMEKFPLTGDAERMAHYELNLFGDPEVQFRVSYRAYNETQEAGYFTIQDAIDDANAGDVIVVTPGSYHESINFKGKAITVRGIDASDWDVVAVTVIGGADSNAVAFDSNEGSDSVLSGLTILNTSGDAIVCDSASPTIANCIIKLSDRAIECVSSSPNIYTCKLFDNDEGIVCLSGSSPDVRGNLIRDNDYGITADGNCSPLVYNNTIVDNAVCGIHKGASAGEPNPQISDCILWGNSDDLNDAFSASYSCIEDYNDCQRGGPGNINTDPCFVDDVNDDFHIAEDSSCIEAGNPYAPLGENEKDIDGQPRFIDADGDGIRQIDMGADEAAYLPECHPDYDEWADVNKPASWVFPRQCHGDADGLRGKICKGWYWVGYDDLDVFIAGFATPYSGDPATDPWIAADFDHAEEKISKQWYRVGYNDLDIFTAYFAKPTVDPNCSCCE